MLFDAPLQGACGLAARVPSQDGSFWVGPPAGETIDCDLSPIDALANLRPAP